MAKSEHVTIKTYDSTDEAKAAEALLVESGLDKNSISRSGKKVRVDAQQERVARSLLEGAEPSTQGGSVMTDEFTGSTSSSYSTGAETTTGQVQDAAADVVDAAQDTASAAVDTAQQAVGAVADKVQDVAATTVDTAQQAVEAVTDKVQDATSVVTDQVAVVADAAAGKVENAADTVWQAGMQPGAPAVQRQAAQTAASVLDKTAEYLRERDLSLIMEDLRGAIRRNPGRTLLLGLGLGYLARGSFFPSTGTQGRQGRMSSPMPAPQPRAVPVYTGEVGASYDTAYTAGDASITYGAGYDTEMTTTAPLASDIAPISDTDTSTFSSADVLGSDVATSTMAGAGALGDLSVDEIDTLAGGTDDTASSLYGSDLGTSSDLTGSGLSTGGSSDLGAISSGDQFTVSDLGDASLGASLGDASGAGAVDNFGSSASDFGSTTGDAFGTGSAGSSTGEGSTSSDNDLLGQWDAQTRGTSSSS